MYPYGPPQQPPNPYAAPPNPYAAPSPYTYDPRENYAMYGVRPFIWPWFIAFCVVMTLMYMSVIGLGVFVLFLGTKDEDVITGVVYAVIGIPFTALYGVAPLLPKKPWVWIYHIVLICLPMTSLCCVPICVPLLIHWLKPETKAFFGRM